MISLKKFLDSAHTDSNVSVDSETSALFSALLAAYCSSLQAMGNCAEDACPTLGDDLKAGLGKLVSELTADISPRTVEATERGVQDQLQSWGQLTARHYQKKTNEVKELLLLMARTAESVGARDQRAAGQLNEVTTRLTTIASLEDLTEIRVSIKKSAAELKTSIDRMAEEGRAAINYLRSEVSNYQAKLEKAEAIAFRDALTGLCSRLYVENQLTRRIDEEKPFCVGIIDIDAFKQVNDTNGHITGDDLLKRFATELKSACRAKDLIGRWGGDEFIILFDSNLAEADAQAERLRKWVCGEYEVKGRTSKVKLNVNASIGLAEYRSGDKMTELLARADAAMYENKSASRAMRR